jgi:hypothetical protein
MPACLARAAAALLLAAAPCFAHAQFSAATQPSGYVTGAFGGNQYDYDCWFWSDCESASSNSGKLAGGVRFGVFGLEAAVIDFGRARLRPSGDELQLRSAGVNAVWYLNLGSGASGLLRAGLAHVQHTRSFDGTRSRTSATFGLAMLVDLAPQVALELGWDVTAGEGNNTSSTTASAVSAGLRIAF